MHFSKKFLFIFSATYFNAYIYMNINALGYCAGERMYLGDPRLKREKGGESWVFSALSPAVDSGHKL